MSRDKIVQLRLLLLEMERDLGLTSLPQLERDVLYAAEDLARTTSAGEFKIADLAGHQLLSATSRASVYRAISALVAQGRLKNSPTERRGYYTAA